MPDQRSFPFPNPFYHDREGDAKIEATKDEMRHAVKRMTYRSWRDEKMRKAHCLDIQQQGVEEY